MTKSKSKGMTKSTSMSKSKTAQVAAAAPADRAKVTVTRHVVGKPSSAWRRERPEVGSGSAAARQPTQSGKGGGDPSLMHRVVKRGVYDYAFYDQDGHVPQIMRSVDEEDDAAVEVQDVDDVSEELVTARSGMTYPTWWGEATPAPVVVVKSGTRRVKDKAAGTDDVPRSKSPLWRRSLSRYSHGRHWR